MMYSNAIKISVIIGSMIAASTKSMQFISVAVLKIIFKWRTEKTRFWTHGLDAQTLDAWKIELWTLGLCKPGRLDFGCMDSASLDASTLNAWTLDAWTLDGDWTLGL